MREPRRLVLVLGVAVAALVVASAATPASGQRAGFQVVVHPSNPATSFEMEELADLFLKRERSWPGGEEVKPVDQGPSSAVRSDFSRRVFDKEVPWIKSYWQKQIFSGRESPPPELESDRAVLDYVRRNPGAIGYVGAAARVGDGVKTVAVEP